MLTICLLLREIPCWDVNPLPPYDIHLYYDVGKVVRSGLSPLHTWQVSADSYNQLVDVTYILHTLLTPLTYGPLDHHRVNIAGLTQCDQISLMSPT